MTRTLLCLTGGHRQEVVAVEMHLEGRIASPHALEQLFLQVGPARRRQECRRPEVRHDLRGQPDPETNGGTQFRSCDQSDDRKQASADGEKDRRHDEPIHRNRGVPSHYEHEKSVVGT